MLGLGLLQGTWGALGVPWGGGQKYLLGVGRARGVLRGCWETPNKVLEWDTLPREFLNGPMFIPIVVVDELNLAHPSGELGWLLDGHGGFFNEHEGKVGGRGRPK